VGIQVARNVFFLFIWVVPVGNASPSVFYIKLCSVVSVFGVIGVGSSSQGFVRRGKINVLTQNFRRGSVKEICKYERRREQTSN